MKLVLTGLRQIDVQPSTTAGAGRRPDAVDGGVLRGLPDGCQDVERGGTGICGFSASARPRTHRCRRDGQAVHRLARQRLRHLHLLHQPS